MNKEARNERITVVLSADEKRGVELMMAQEGYESASRWVRDLIMDYLGRYKDNG